jgi:DnaK suppressor protein
LNGATLRCVDLVAVRTQLESERARLESQRDRLEGVLGAATVDDAPDDALDLVLAQIETALERLVAGTYGRCAACGAPITPSRLAALPYATRCVTCADRRD